MEASWWERQCKVGTMPVWYCASPNKFEKVARGHIGLQIDANSLANKEARQMPYPHYSMFPFSIAVTTYWQFSPFMAVCNWRKISKSINVLPSYVADLHLFPATIQYLLQNERVQKINESAHKHIIWISSS